MAGKKSIAKIPDDCPINLRCNRCHEVKHRDGFDRNSATPTTFSRCCKECNTIMNREKRFRGELRDRGVVEFTKSLAMDIAVLTSKIKVLQEFTNEDEPKIRPSSKGVGGAKRVYGQTELLKIGEPVKSLRGLKKPGRPRKANPVTKDQA